MRTLLNSKWLEVVTQLNGGITESLTERTLSGSSRFQ